MNVRRYLVVALAAAVSTVAVATPAHAAIGDITTIAGTGTRGYSGDSGPATSAQLDYLFGIDVDAAGNVYIADYGNDCIRKVTAGTGNITTIAGTGTAGFSGDDSLATAAQLRAPNDVAVDTAGNVYIADSGNNRIRKIAVGTGNITTIAGTGTAGFSGDDGLATAAQLNYPTGISVDTSGNLYITDSYNHRIRKVSAANGKISTIAGNGTAGFSGDDGLATAAKIAYPQDAIVDSVGNVYISDYGNNRIRKVAAATGIMTTFAGTGAIGSSGDDGLATAATLGNGTGYLGVDSSDNVYISDYSNYRIRRVTPATGIITTVAGTGVQGYDGDGGPATSAAIYGPWAVAVRGSSMYIGDYDKGVIRMVALAPLPDLPPTGADTDALVWLAAAMLAAGAVLLTTLRSSKRAL